MFPLTSHFSPVTHSAIYRGSIQHAHKACGENCFCDQLLCRSRSAWSEIINTDWTQHIQVTPQLCCLCLQKSRGHCLRLSITLCASCLPLLCSGGSFSKTFLSQWVPFFHLPMPYFEITIYGKLSWAWHWADEKETIKLECYYLLKEYLFLNSPFSLLCFYKWVPTSMCECKGIKAVWEKTAPAWLHHHLIIWLPLHCLILILSGSGRSENAVFYFFFFLTKSTAKVQQSLTSSGRRG